MRKRLVEECVGMVYLPVMPALRLLIEEEHVFETCLSYIARHCSNSLRMVGEGDLREYLGKVVCSNYLFLGPEWAKMLHS